MTQPPATPKRNTNREILIVAVVIVVAVSLIGYFGAQSASNQDVIDRAEQQTAQLEQAARAPVTFAGDGQANSVQAAMSGNYTFAWQTSGSCYYAADLEGGTFSESVFSADSALTGSGNLYDLEALDYYLQMITGPSPNCAWTITFTPA